MTRRLNRSKRVLSVDAYIHRATLGLPRDERLDAAAELRTHLLDRVAQLQGQGFARDEAEHLAVRGMGEVSATNRGLLGHALTHRAGWAALALLLVGGGGWWTYREWLPPGEGLAYSEMTAGDTKLLFSLPAAPRGSYHPMQVTFPKATRSVVVAFVSQDIRQLRVMNVAPELPEKAGRVPGSYRYQQRWLILPAVALPSDLPWSRQCESPGLFFLARSLPSNLFPYTPREQIGDFVQYASCFPDETRRAEQLSLHTGHADARSGGFKLNEWSVIFTSAYGFGGQSRDLYIAVLPTARELQSASFPAYTVQAGRARLNGDDRALPQLPALR